MQIAIEISMYPFRPDYEPPILDFIDQLKEAEGLRVEVNDMSTQIFGAFDTVMPKLQSAIKEAFSEEQVTVMVMKVLHVPEG
ncbi:MAG: YkoF family thiamine/hydroxymethylpyrimidine-binding protein [Phaeodactylibacter sp.]|uniref:YkoF family thiamine/hydroxymethylpyrimidine-binding protein n=1 Tax=Phaeodactylibacter sp. TaxID=1940289 RepID=UPI0032EC4164